MAADHSRVHFLYSRWHVARCTFLVGASIAWFYPAEWVHAELTINEIRAIIADELESVHSIRIKYKATIKSHPPYSLGNGTAEREWIRDGDKRLRSMKPRQGRDGRWFGNLQTYDGAVTHNVVFDPQDPNRYAKVAQTQSFTANDWKPINPEYCLGQSIPSTEESLATLLARPRARVLGTADIDGFSCVHIDLGMVTESDGVEWAAETWLSPERHYLPVKISLKADSEAPASKKVELAPNAHYVFRNLKWGQYHDKSLNRVRHYPTYSEFDCALSLNIFEITEISINEAIPISEFQPQPSFGSDVIVRSIPRDPDEKRYIAGGEPAIRERQQKLVENALRAVPKGTPTQVVDARPNEGLWTAHLWKLTLTLFLLTSAYCFYLSRRTSS